MIFRFLVSSEISINIDCHGMWCSCLVQLFHYFLFAFFKSLTSLSFQTLPLPPALPCTNHASCLCHHLIPPPDPLQPLHAFCTWPFACLTLFLPALSTCLSFVSGKLFQVHPVFLRHPDLNCDSTLKDEL